MAAEVTASGGAIARLRSGMDRAAGAVLEFCERHAGALLVLLLAVGAVMRAVYWGRFWLNPDEGIFWSAATAAPERAARVVAGNANPPLYYLVLRAVHMLGGGSDAMRGLSLAAGLAFPGVAFLLARRWAGAAAGVFAALVLVNAPGVRELSLMMRPYALLIVALGLGTLCFFRFLDGGRLRDAVVCGVGWSIAMLMHYCTYIALAGAAAYAGWLLVTSRLGRREVLGLAWSFGLPFVPAVWAWWTHVLPGLEGSAMQAEAQEGWLRPFFAASPGMLLANYFGAMRYVFADPFAWLAGLLVAAAPWLAPDPAGRRPTLLALTTLAVAFVLSVMQQYPFGQSRHVVYLSVFLAPAAGAALVGLLRSRRLAALGLLGVGLALATLVFHPGVRGALPIRTVDARALADALHSRTAPGDLILLDVQSSYVVRTLLPGAGAVDPVPGAPDLLAFEAEGRRYVLFRDWMLEVDERRDELRALLERLDGLPDAAWSLDRQPVWLLQAGWGVPLGARLPARLPDGRPLRDAVFRERGVMLLRLAARNYLASAPLR